MEKPMSRSLRSLIAAMLATAAVAAPSVASADWIIRAGGAWLEPEQADVDVGTNGNKLRIDDDGAVVAADVTWLFRDHLGVELWASDTFNSGLFLENRAAGQRGVDSVDFQAPTLSLQWHFNPDGIFRPYIGGGVAYTMVDNEARSPIYIDDGTGWTVGGGVDIGERYRGFLVNLYAKYIDFSPEAKVTPGSTVPVGDANGDVDLGNWDINPMIYGVNIGYRFGQVPAEPVAEAEPVPVAPPPAPEPEPVACADGDNDGVCDEVDKCPNTPAGAKVDKAGCPLEQTLKVLFDFDSSELRPESLTELERVVTFMNDVPFATALIEGHTDSVGTEEYNQALSDRRAKAVFDYLSSRGIDPARLKSIGHGELKPIADNATAEGRQLNRRVMLIRTDSGM
jgi:OOP family OmpA-OmpF porin